MAGEESLLTDLCRICHTNAPKYKCPRCSVRTCSLECSKRHKVWSQCSGVRDPAAYLKRNELATPAAFDRDYNFISGIERGLERAERDADNRGIELNRGPEHDTAHAHEHGHGHGRRPRFARHANGPKRGEMNVQKALERTRVIVDRAPKGMTRERENRTSWNKKYKCLSWTVEWFHPDGRRELSGCLETWALCEAYRRILEKDVSRKRKREDDTGPSNTNDTNTNDVQSATGDMTAETDKPAENQDTSTSKHESENVQTAASVEPPSTDQSIADSNCASTEPPTQSTQPKQPRDSTEPFHPQTSSLAPAEQPSANLPPQELPHLHFYLLKPHTASSHKVLIPVSQSSVLSECLREREVLEFPTFYVFQQDNLLSSQSQPQPHSQSQSHVQSAVQFTLPPDFILEGDYLGQQTAEQQEIQELLKHVPASELAQAQGQDTQEATSDESRFVNDEVLRVLKRDMGGAEGSL